MEFTGESWPASGRVQAQMYGEKLPYVRNVKIQGDYVIERGKDGVIRYVFESGLVVCEKDGLCLDFVPGGLTLQPLMPDGKVVLFPDEKTFGFSEIEDPEPDFEIISITPFRPLRLEAMRR